MGIANCCTSPPTIEQEPISHDKPVHVSSSALLGDPMIKPGQRLHKVSPTSSQSRSGTEISSTNPSADDDLSPFEIEPGFVVPAELLFGHEKGTVLVRNHACNHSEDRGCDKAARRSDVGRHRRIRAHQDDPAVLGLCKRSIARRRLAGDREHGWTRRRRR